MTEAKVQQGERKLLSLQAGRAFASSYVVLFHTPGVLEDRMDVRYENTFVNAGHSGVEFFFVLSGFIIAYVHRHDFGRPSRLGRYTRNRVLRIYPIYWFVIAVSACGQILLNSVDPILMDSSNTLRAVLLLPFEGETLLGVAWTLSHEMLFYILFGVCVVWMRVGACLLLIWWAVCAAALLGVAVSGDTGWWTDFPMNFFASPRNLLFGFGIVAAFAFTRVTTWFASYLLAAGIAGFVWSIMYFGRLETPLSMLSFGAFATLIILGAAALESRNSLFVPRWLVFLGNASYSTYLVHVPAMVFVSLMIIKLDNLEHLGVFPMMAILFGAGIGAGCVLYLLVERPMAAAFQRSKRAAAPSDSSAS